MHAHALPRRLIWKHCKAGIPGLGEGRDIAEICSGIGRRAREKRERLRGSHLAPDYIPLGGVAGLGAAGALDASAAAGEGVATRPPEPLPCML